MIDEYHISMIPALIGKGARLFEDFDHDKRLSLIKTLFIMGLLILNMRRSIDFL